MKPMTRANTRARMTPTQKFRPSWVAVSAAMMLLAPMMEPTERSNSPAIMSRATATARMPSWAATSRMVAVPLAETKPRFQARMAKTTQTMMAPNAAPISGRSRRRRQRGNCLLRAVSRIACGSREPTELDI